MSDNYMNYSNAEEIFGGYAQSINKIKPTPITYAAYQALSAEEKAAKRYMITDYPSQNDSYNDLTNKPQINSVTLAGNKSAHDLGLVAEEAGKGLSSNDYTTAEKTKLAGLENYDDTQLAGRVSAIEGVIPNDATTLNKLATEDDIPDTTNFIEKSVTTGLVKNDGTIDTHTYVQSSDLGTAAGKDYTDRVSPNNRNLVESQSVYSAIQSAVSSIYTPRGDLTCAELTSALLIAENVGDVYEMTDAGTTTALFLQGAGETIAVGANVGIINAGEGRILFNLMPGAFDLTDYQKKELDDPLIIGGVSRTEVEPALGALNTAKADKSEMSVTAGTGADADKTIIQLKSGTTATVLHAHQDISGKVDKSNTAGLLKNDGTVDTNTYMTASDIAGKAEKSEMSIVDGSGASADKTTITLKTGTSATVLKEHQDISGKAEKSEMSVTPGTGANADKTTIQLKEGTSATVLTQHQSLDAKADKILVATNNNLIAMDANGNIKDSGKSASDFASQNEVNDIVNVLGAKNLLPNKATTQTIGGVTYTINSDGTINMSGTNNSGSWININICDSDTLKAILSKHKGQKMIFSMTQDYNYDTRNVCIHYSIGGTDTYIIPNPKEIEFTVPNNIDTATSITVPVGITTGETASTTNLGLMLRLASDPDSTYVPYAMTNQQMTPYVQAISNPNLLDNPWFTINQRGESSYTTVNTYTVDRWILGRGSVTSRASNTPYIMLQTLEENKTGWIRQKTEYNFDVAKSITLSAIIESNLTAEYGVALKISNQNNFEIGAIKWFPTVANQKTLIQFTVNPYENTSFEIISSASICAVKVYAMKLELGTVSTLAMDIAPNYQQELAKCMRYFQKIGKTTTASIGKQISVSMAHLALDIWFPVFLPVPLRILPSIEKKTGTWMITQSGTQSPLTVSPTLSIAGTDTTDVSELNISAVTTQSEPMTVGEAYKLSTKAEAGQALMFLSADL